MSVCLEPTSTPSTALSTSTNEVLVPVQAPTVLTLPENVVEVKEPTIQPKGIAKLVVNNQQIQPGNPLIQKVVNSPLITVLNSTGPLTVVKSLCMTSMVASAPQYTLVNTTATNQGGKGPTITVLNCGSPVTVVKALTGSPPHPDKPAEQVTAVVSSVVANPVSPILIENRGHNVFVKNSSGDLATMPEMPQSHKLLTATNFSPNNIIGNVNPSLKSPTINGQRNKVKILGNVQLANPQNVILNKTSTITPQPRYNLTGARQKLININPPTAAKPMIKPNNVLKPVINPVKSPPQKLHPPMQKGPIKNFIPKPGIKTLSPQHKNIPSPVHRSGLKTIPPQRPQKGLPKTNYIGKHAVQAQKVKPQKLKAIRPPGYGYHAAMHDKQLTFNQALTAQIIETLSNTSNPPSGRYELSPARYDNAFNCPETSPEPKEEDKVKALDALSLICQAVLLDHNYNATLPSESPPRVAAPINTQSPMNGLPPSGVYSTIPKRRVLPLPPPPMVAPVSPIAPLAIPNVLPLVAPVVIPKQDDDAASDVSDISDRKHDTEGEETDTAPEAEDVKNDEHYGDYVTRCLCGFLHDDGYMVECDKCKVWQHVQCVSKNRQLPDEYLCEICDPSKPIDRHRARLVQQQWLKERQLIEPKIRKEAKMKEVVRNMTDTDSSDGEVRNNNVKRVSMGRRKSESNKIVKKEGEPVRRKRKERKIVKRRPKLQVRPQQQQSHSDDENQDSWTTAHLPTLRKWIEVYEEAVTNHYSPELRKRISSVRVNGVHADTTSYDTNVNNCRIHTQPLTEIKYLVSTVELEPNMPVIELRGKYMLGQQHKNNMGSLTTRQHTQRPGPFLFFYKLPKDNTEVCVDTRTYGNSARFVRRSCKPNAELRHCIDKGVLHLYIVSITSVDKNCELTIRHESHDLAVVGTTQIACACGKPDECLANKTTIKKNGDVGEVVRKRRGRRTISSSLPSPDLKSPIKEPVVEPPIPEVPPEPLPEPIVEPPPPEPPSPEKEPEKPTVEEPAEPEKVEEVIKPEPEPVVQPQPEPEKEEKRPKREKSRSPSPVKVEPPPKKEKRKHEEDKLKSPPLTPIVTRRSSHKNSEKEDSGKEETAKEKKEKAKKLSREERKLEAILRAIEQMEKADQKKQEHQAKQAHRRESEPGPGPKEEERPEPRIKRRRRRGRARTTSTNQTRRSRLNSTDSYLTSGDENLLSPNDSILPSRPKDLENMDSKAAGLLLALSNGDADKEKKIDNMDSSSNSSPETPQLSSACLLVQAAVEPLESGFKFPKTKKGMMNEWLNKTPDMQPASAISPSALMAHVHDEGGKNLVALAQAATLCDTPTQQKGNAKKRWLRQAISEDHTGDSPGGRADSPPLSDAVAPPKKRRLPRESLSTDNSPPTTPTSSTPAKLIDTPRSSQEGPSDTDCDSPTSRLAAELRERAIKMKEQLHAVDLSVHEHVSNYFNDILDPRLREKNNFATYNSAHLVGTVEKTLSIFGFEGAKTPPTTPVKRKVKLSISEYRQRKKLHTDDIEIHDSSSQGHDDNNSTDSFKGASQTSVAVPKSRSRSSSSSSSLSSLDEPGAIELTMKAPVFNSEPTELERQREITSQRLKKAFGIADESRKAPVIDMASILNCDMETKLLAMSPTQEETPDRTPTPVLEPIKDDGEGVATVEEDVTKCEEKMEVEEQQEKDVDDSDKTDDHMFYTPDEEEEKHEEGVVVPAFNNPVYPTTNFVSFTSAIDDDTRYQSRNPSPPPDLEAPSFTAS